MAFAVARFLWSNGLEEEEKYGKENSGGVVWMKEEVETASGLGRDNIMGTLPVNRLLLTMAWPMVLSMFIQGCYNIVDSIFVSYVSQDAFIALSLVYPVQLLLISVNVGIGVGINALLSRRLGERRYAEANDVAAHGYVIYLSFGLLFAVAGLLFARPFMELYSENQTVIE